MSGEVALHPKGSLLLSIYLVDIGLAIHANCSEVDDGMLI